MDFTLGFLTFGTLGFVAAFAYISARVAEKQFEDSRRRRTAAQAGVRVPAQG